MNRNEQKITNLKDLLIFFFIRKSCGKLWVVRFGNFAGNSAGIAGILWEIQRGVAGIVAGNCGKVPGELWEFPEFPASR